MTNKYYDHKKIETKWQNIWEKENVFVVDEKSVKPKYYALGMFPYPSAEGLHVGHPESYTAIDIISRYRRLRGDNVLNPIGFDAFGLPAENYAIKQGRPPWETTKANIKNFTRQIKSFGFSYDWSRVVDTSDPSYYRWTQWIFLQMYKNGLAYKKKAKVNWCLLCKTVLANEQVADGKCDRCKSEVIQKDLEQWFFKTTKYAEELLGDLSELDWPEPIKAAQRNWIGKSEGALLKFQIANFKLQIEVFTTRPDTLFGATYMVLAPEHQLVQDLKEKIANWGEVEKYILKAQRKSELERGDLNKEKTGVELEGVKAINPASGKEIPVFIADYVQAGYGTGAIMAVPAHDRRDFEFAKDYDQPIIQVIDPASDDYLDGKFFSFGIHNASLGGEDSDAAHKRQLKTMGEILIRGDGCYFGEGKIINSAEFDGLDNEEAKQKITAKVGGEMKIQYHLRDWLISRQRYWGAPIPIIYCDKCGEVPVPEEELPVVLPQDVDFKPTGESPLRTSKEFHQATCPFCGNSGEGVIRESDTMDTFVCSSWYYLRYTDAKNDTQAFSKEKIDKWMPVDLYIGGAEHAVMHLLYARFFTKALRDFGFFEFSEPFIKLRNQGMITGEDGQKMSKSRGNVINPDEVVVEYGADTIRLYEMFMGPLEDGKPWSTKGIIGSRRFLEKLWLVVGEWLENGKPSDESKELNKLFHKTIKKVTEDIEAIKFNTAISAMMILVNQMAKEKKFTAENLNKLLKILSPFAPHIAEEIYSLLGGKDFICLQSWPVWDEKLIVDDSVEIGVQINGKLRSKIIISADLTEEDIFTKVFEDVNIKKYLQEKQVIKKIYVPKRLVNIVVK